MSNTPTEPPVFEYARPTTLLETIVYTPAPWRSNIPVPMLQSRYSTADLPRSARFHDRRPPVITIAPGTTVDDGDSITIGTVTYTFKDDPTEPCHVPIVRDPETDICDVLATAENMRRAINGYRWVPTLDARSIHEHRDNPRPPMKRQEFLEAIDRRASLLGKSRKETAAALREIAAAGGGAEGSAVRHIADLVESGQREIRMENGSRIILTD